MFFIFDQPKIDIFWIAGKLSPPLTEKKHLLALDWENPQYSEKIIDTVAYKTFQCCSIYKVAAFILFELLDRDASLR